ncbi:FAD-dependent oxidoreductase [Geodermatophilus sp. CPCC 205506]|uniref:FAD-dependent oxidoreductase n=1 Tax=Geodermatophilus sp. CPCC 205506 TaxID=2936596 RepID=UPI003EEB824A
MPWDSVTAAPVSADRPVVVVGAGPVGMTAAATLAHEGLPVVVVELHPEPRPDWRASTFHAATLELLETIDITGQMHAEGLVVPKYQFRDRVDGLVAEFDFRLLADETRYPYRLQLNQQHLVRMLYDRLRQDPNVSLRFGTELTGLRVEADGPVLELRGPDGAPTELAASYVIGADGPRSAVRNALGVPFEGFTYPERFAITSTSVDLQELLPDLGHVNYVADPEEWLFILRTPESWRVVWPVPEGMSLEEATAPERLQQQLQRVAPYEPGYPVIDHQVYNVHQRVAGAMRVGPVLLAGDAAHINSPIGGVGLNSGIHDAMDAARRLARIARGEGDPEAELATYDRVRRTVAREYVQADTQRNTDRLRERDDAVRRQHQEDMRAIAADPERARAYIRRVSLLESVQRFGIGRPPAELELEALS